MRRIDHFFVDNMPEDTQVKWLMWAFSRFGKVVDAFIPASSRRGRHKCFGIVPFRYRFIAEKAIDVMN